MYVKWFDTGMFYYVIIILKKNLIFKKFQICRRFWPPYVPTSQGPEHGSRMSASAGGDGRGRCRGHIAGAKDKVSAAGNP
ncbi:unnamed protein product [Staurois parvus]|uniref:Uncharacterized protein n=1 Tax=Staurois parvus TaxID=386267 RepID=A0ABN9GJP2_9NEOB|nr:unnamed protein product [Staurois parvus]